jgi:glycosyltransferase involved in cell wall biosynthesis
MTDAKLVYDRRGPLTPNVSFLVPIYNERRTVDALLDRLAQVGVSQEIILVDDGSTDGTRNLLSGKERDGVALFFHPENRGKGGAIQTALAQARGRYAAIQDADLEYDPVQYRELLAVARRDNMPAVIGSRFLRDNPTAYRRFLWGNKLLTFWINLLCGSRFTDTYTCYKLIQTDVFRSLNLTSRGFEMEAEICAKIARRHIHFTECPISYAPRRVEEGKKIRWKDAVKGLWAALLHR